MEQIPERSLPHEPAAAGSTDPVARIRACLQHLEHLLPAQAPLRDFVHHNTLHAFQHLPFAEALGAVARLTGARPWLAEARCHELFRQQRVTVADLDAALRQLPQARAEERLFASATLRLSRGEVLRAALLSPLQAISPTRLRWQGEEMAAFGRLQADLDPAARERFLTAAGLDGLDERAAVADLWAAAGELRPPVLAGDPTASAEATPLDPASPEAAAALWQRMLGRLGHEWTLLALLTHLTGEDAGESLRATLIRHLAAHLDQGLAAWRNPARGQGFYAAWRHSAGSDWAWELDEFARARHEIETLPEDPLSAIADQLRCLTVDEAQWGAYLERLALDLPGWAGMCRWRAAHHGADEPPVGLSDLLAVRVVLERLHAEQIFRRLWGLPLRLSELGDYFVAHPAELSVRHAFGNRELPEELLDAVWPRLAVPSEKEGGGWQDLATRRARAGGAACAARADWPLFLLAQGLGLSARQLREMAAAGAEDLLRCAASLSADERGLVWLLAYEHHHRQQILAALVANHGRASASSGPAQAQFVLCMDDREEGSRRHLEEVNPAFETFGAAGFFGLPMLWQGLDDETPTAQCPVVVRPENTVREEVPPGAEAAHRWHRRRRQLRLAWRERLHQGSRRGGLQAALLIAAAAPRIGFSEAEQVARVGGFLRSIGLTSHFAPLLVIVGHGSDSRNNPHLAAYDCGACSGRHGGANARVLAAMANRPALRARLAEQGIVIPDTTHFVGAEHNTCDETFVWYDGDQIPARQREAFAALARDCQEAARRHAVERCRRFASAPRRPTPEQARRHLADRCQDIAQARPELGHATIATAFVGRRTMSRRAFFDRRVFLISYDPLPDVEGRILEATLLAAGPVGAGINLEYYFSTVDNEGFGCGSKVMHNLAGLFGVMQGASSDLRTGLPLQMIEIHEPMRLLVVVEQTLELLATIYQRQPPLQELIDNGWIVLAAKHPQSGAIHLFDPASGWQPWAPAADDASTETTPTLAEVDRSVDCFSGRRNALPPALLRYPRETA